jgi:hypothetical protein
VPTSIPLPKESDPYTPGADLEATALAASGGSLYMGSKQGLWVWEESSDTRIIPKSTARRRTRAQGRFPVPVWALPDGDGSGKSPGPIDAKGALRR